jgi:hypothetical protein
VASTYTFRCSSARNAKGILLGTFKPVWVRYITHLPRLRHSPPSSVIRHHKVRETILRDVVEEILFPDIGKLAIVGWDLGEDGLGRCAGRRSVHTISH